MYSSIEAKLINKGVKVGGIYWHPNWARLVRVTRLEIRFDGVAAVYEFVHSTGDGVQWCFAGVLRSHNQLKAETLKLLADFQANRTALDAFAKLEG